MPPEVMTIFNNIIPIAKNLSVSYSGYILLSLLGLIVAVFSLQWGWSSLNGIMKSDGRAVTFGSPLGYHGTGNDDVEKLFSHGAYRESDDIAGTNQDSITFFGISGDERNEYVWQSAHGLKYFSGLKTCHTCLQNYSKDRAVCPTCGNT